MAFFHAAIHWYMTSALFMLDDMWNLHIVSNIMIILKIYFILVKQIAIM